MHSFSRLEQGTQVLIILWDALACCSGIRIRELLCSGYSVLLSKATPCSTV